MSSEKRSWGHRIYRRTYPYSKECSAPGCTNHPEFKIYMRVSGDHARNLAYCSEHAQQFAKNYDIRMPRINEAEAARIDLFVFESKALVKLKGRIEGELARRSQKKDDFTFRFNSTGTNQKESTPYVARLRWKDGRLDRVFLNFNLERIENENGTVTICGEYSVRPGSIVERRMGRIDTAAIWRRYLVNDEGVEIPVSMKGDQERNALVEKYLRREINREDLVR